MKQRDKHKKRVDILRNFLYKDNRCNEELALQVEQGGGYQFLDCPPILFSPAESPNGTSRAKKESHSKSKKKPMRGSLDDQFGEFDRNDNNKTEEKKNEFKSRLWAVLANISEDQLQKLNDYKANMNRNELKQQNIKAAFTYGRKINHRDVSKVDYQKQFQPLVDALTRSTAKIVPTKKKRGGFERSFSIGMMSDDSAHAQSFDHVQQSNTARKRLAKLREVQQIHQRSVQSIKVIAQAQKKSQRLNKKQSKMHTQRVMSCQRVKTEPPIMNVKTNESAEFSMGDMSASKKRS